MSFDKVAVTIWRFVGFQSFRRGLSVVLSKNTDGMLKDAVMHSQRNCSKRNEKRTSDFFSQKRDFVSLRISPEDVSSLFVVHAA